MIRLAERKKAKLRLGIASPSGGGKTYSSLLIAKGLVNSNETAAKIGFIDTERGSGELYSHLFPYSVISISDSFEPKKYVQAIKEFERAGFEVIIIDSLSHAWAGEGGILDIHGKIGGNSYTAWRTVTPQHNSLVDAILQSSCHVICTLRSKQDYVIEQNELGKAIPKKVGLAPVQREGMEYEFTVMFDIDMKHIASVSKDRTELFDGKFFVPNIETGKKLLTWLNSGKEELPEQKNDEVSVDNSVKKKIKIKLRRK